MINLKARVNSRAKGDSQASPSPPPGSVPGLSLSVISLIVSMEAAAAAARKENTIP